MSLNEATLTARLHKILETVFPSFSAMNIEHQGSFSLKFGHHNVKVDMKDPSKYPNRAIFDMLLRSNGLNLMLVELKKEGHAITEDDVKQGLSYARLLPKMPPIVLISNGIENRLYDTYSMQKCNEDSIDLKFIQDRINSSFSLAISDFKNAINFLLNRRPELVGKVVSKISLDRFQIQMGEIDDLNKPICKDFQIKRKIIKRIYKKATNGENVIGLLGHAFSGKTNILYQYFREYGFQPHHYILYINLKDNNFSIFQQLAQEFSKETKDYISKDKIRDWFMSLLHTEQETRFMLLVDNLQKGIPDEITNEFLELVSLFKGSNHSIIYTIDEWSYKQIAYETDRNYKTLIGSLTQIFRVNDLNRREFQAVNKWLFKTCRTIIPLGGQFCEEYRKLRVLRVMAATYSKNAIMDGAYSRFGTIADLDLIMTIANNKIFTKNIHQIYKKLSVAFLKDESIRKQIPELNIVAKTMGAFSLNTFKREFPDDYLAIIKSGLVAERTYRKNLDVIIPNVPELLLFHSIELITMLLTSKQPAAVELYKTFIALCEQQPSSDIMGAAVLRAIGEKDPGLFTSLIEQCLNDPPEKQSIKKGTEILAFSKNYGHIKFKFDTDMEEESLIAQHLPFSILSQLVDRPLAAEDQFGNRVNDLFMDLLLKLASIPQFSQRVQTGSFDMTMSVLGSELPKAGYILSPKNGIIETLVQSIQKCFLIDHILILNLCEKAIETKSYAAIWRIYLALNALQGIADVTLELTARKIEFNARLAFYKVYD